MTDEELRRIARAIEYRPMTPERTRAVRAEILLAIRRTKRPAARRYPLAAAAILLIAAVGLALFWSREDVPPPAQFIAAVRSLAGDRPRRTIALEDGSRRETVALTSGRMEVVVPKLRRGERFIVTTDDAEVEVRGTRFEVEARGGLLVEVSVQSGLVEVRPRGRAVALLRAGEKWTRPSEAPEAEPIHALDPPRIEPAIQKQKQKQKQKRTESRKPTRAERAFQAGWSAYREGRIGEAIEAFDRVVRLAPNSALAEDASYWRERARSEEERDRYAR